MQRAVCFLSVLLFVLAGKAQVDLHVRGGLSLQFGTHIQRFGLMYQVFVLNDFMQAGNGMTVHFNRRGLGPGGRYAELKFQISMQGHWGWERSRADLIFNEFSNLSHHAYAAGYSFYVYRGGKQLNQTAGSVYGTVDQFRLAIDNDAFGTNPYEDKYRTGAFLFSWKTDEFLWSVQSTLWTGKSYDAPKVKGSDYPARKGYRDPSRVAYGQYSHGILAVRMDYAADYDQSVRLEAGIDSEHIRNFVQNKVVHDLMPDRWVGYENPHYPMLQEDGSPFLYKPDQRVKSPKPYFQLGVNQFGFY